MATQLIKHLENCAKNDAIYKPLEYQWGFDEQLIAKALQNVCVYFPHYSRHDESHSRQILVHIERLLGEKNISRLTATDTWLLLEAAYLHDIGMVVTDKQLTDNFEEIKKHATSMKYTASGDSLIVIEALLASKGNTASAIFAAVNLKAFQTLKLLREIIADYYRKKHPEQAGKIITHPLLEIGLDSPRNELLPARFFGLLSKICEYHGASFEKVMELPQQQVGMGTEDCHPRFVACLLRLGDLLDLDDNRFCPVMMKMAGDLPDLSKAHHEKHLAIRHFRADPDRIEITAECPDYESYIETTKWFGWLRDEVKNQMSRWFDIVPARHFGLLPSVGDLKAHLKEWQVFSENQRPHFELDRDRIFELLQGAGLYECKEQAMRELLQNAVDATLIRIWREHGEDCEPKPKPFIKSQSAPRDKEVIDILDKYSIDVTIEKEKDEGEFNYWRITIADQGTGISREDLKFMMQMGSSKKNSKRREIIEKMPVWMKPSGIFGIGLHSVFLLTDEVLIETRSIDTGETLVIRLTNPTDKKEHGNVYFQIITKPTKIELNNLNAKEKIQEFKPWDFSNFGCKLSFFYKTDKNYFCLSPSLYTHKVLQKYDGLMDFAGEESDIIEIRNEVRNFFKYSLLLGKLNFVNINEFDNTLNEQPYWFNKENKLELIDFNVDLKPQSNVSKLFTYNNKPKAQSSCFYYRGQPINDEEMLNTFYFIIVCINLLEDEADKILSIDRNKIKTRSVSKELINNSIKTVQIFFNNKEGENFYNSLNDDYKVMIASEYRLQEWTTPNYFSDWRKIVITTNEGEKSIESLKQHSCIVFYPHEKDFEIVKEKSDCLNAIFIGTEHNSNVWTLTQDFLDEENFKAVYISFDKPVLSIIQNDNQEPIPKKIMQQYCITLLKKEKYFFLFDVYSLKRYTIPCLNKYKLLELENPNILPSLKNDYKNSLKHDFELDLISPRMLFPLARIGDKITVGDLNILAERVSKNSASKASVEQIKEKYQEFINFLDDLMKEDEDWKDLRSEGIYASYKKTA